MKNFITSVIILTCFCCPLRETVAQGRFDRPSFFRDGQQLMDREIQRLQQQSDPDKIEHPSQLLTIDTGELRWQKFLFQDGNFSVWMPQGIKSSETVTLRLANNDLSFEVLASHPQSYRFVAAYSEDLNSDQMSNSEKLLNQVIEGIIEETNFTLITNESINWQQYQGKKLTMKDEDELISFRVYLINNKVYVLAGGKKDQMEEVPETILSFFDSFRLL